MIKPDRPLRIALLAEAVTLAHVARPIALARALAPAGHQLLLACDPRYSSFAADGPWEYRPLRSIPSAEFNKALAQGKPVYSFEELSGYLDDDLRLIGSFKPDLVVGDFRLSLSVSARLARVPYAAIANAYWSPNYPGGYMLPVIPLSRALPVPIARSLFNVFGPLAFIPHCQPLNRLRRQHNLPSLGNNLRRVYTDSDHLLIPDIPDLYPVNPGSHGSNGSSYIGPLMWSPSVPLPDWWDEPNAAEHATVYVTLGSSGPAHILPLVLQALADLPVKVWATTAGAQAPSSVPANARLASYLPGDAAAQRAKLMICNGGSLSTQQAIAAGIPILGLASNMDQFLNMAPIERHQAGICLRSDRLNPENIRRAAGELLASNTATTAAGQLRQLLKPDVGIREVFQFVANQLLEKAHSDTH